MNTNVGNNIDFSKIQGYLLKKTNKSLSYQELNTLRDYCLTARVKKGDALGKMIKEVECLVCDYYQVTMDELKSKKRHRRFVIPRQVYSWALRGFCNKRFVKKNIKHMSQVEFSMLGYIFNRDHSTIIHSVQSVSDLIESNNSEIVNGINYIINTIGGEIACDKETGYRNYYRFILKDETI